jgi:hypothetical protein
VDFHLRIAKEATGLRKLQLLLKWAAERKDVLEAILSGEGTVG